MANIHDLKTPGLVTASQSGDGGGIDHFDQRIARIEAHLEHTAKKEDIESIRAEIQSANADQIKWLIRTSIGIGGFGLSFAGLVAFIVAKIF